MYFTMTGAVAADDDAAPIALAAMHDGIGLDGGRAGRMLDDGRMRQGVDLGLDHMRVLALPSALDRIGGIDPDRLLGQEPAVGSDQPLGSALLAQLAP